MLAAAITARWPGRRCRRIGLPCRRPGPRCPRPGRRRRSSSGRASARCSGPTWRGPRCPMPAPSLGPPPRFRRPGQGSEAFVRGSVGWERSRHGRGSARVRGRRHGPAVDSRRSRHRACGPVARGLVSASLGLRRGRRRASGPASAPRRSPFRLRASVAAPEAATAPVLRVAGRASAAREADSPVAIVPRRGPARSAAATDPGPAPARGHSPVTSVARDLARVAVPASAATGRRRFRGILPGWAAATGRAVA